MSEFSTPIDQAIKAVTAPGSPFEITQYQSQGVDYRIYAHAPKNLIELVAPGRGFTDKEFVIYQDQRWTFSHFHRQADRLAVQLIRRFNIQKGDRVAIAMRNYPEWMAAFLAIVSVGAVAVPLNSWGVGKELQQNLAEAHCGLIFCDQQRLDIIRPQSHGLAAIVVRHQDALPQDCHSYNDVMSDQSIVKLSAEDIRAVLSNIEIDAQDDAMIMFTSGTSGTPKAALFTHFNCCQSITNFEAVSAAAYMTNIDAYTKHLNSGRPSKALITVPLFHVSGLFAQFLLTLRGGRTMVLMYKWDPVEACDLMTEEQITILVAAPSMLLDLARHPKFSTVDTSVISNVSGAGAATPAKAARFLKEKFSESLPGSGWGMTETGAAGASFTGYFYHLKRGSSGFLNPIVDLRFCNEDGIELEAGAPGEIWIKSPTTITGYVNNPGANENEFKDGWFKTGDIGYLDADKCLFICGRAKDMVIRGGENIFPVEVENTIQSLPAVIGACGFAVPSEHYGEELMMVVRVAPEDLDQVDEKMIQDHCQENLAKFKVPSMVIVTDQAFPLNASNKVVKKQVKALFSPT
jgi:acyl-CoA synthetase (AMP-forming)/AMP-acid ligase II